MEEYFKLSDSTGTLTYNKWDYPVLIKTTEVGESIEMLYEETSNIYHLTYPTRRPERRVFKIVYSCKDGKWHKSNRIYGNIIPAQEEKYEFD